MTRKYGTFLRLLSLVTEFIAWPLLILLWLDKLKWKHEVDFQRSNSEYGKRLLVLMPFTALDIPKLKENISRWDKIRPTTDHSHIEQYVDLAFYYNFDIVLDYDVLRKIQQLEHQIQKLKAFRKVWHISANLDRTLDRYPDGASQLFFKAFDYPIIKENYAFMYWMEPDNFPVRPGWLEKLYSKATSAGPNVWCIGAIRRDVLKEKDEYPHLKEHINGNALYRLDDSNFDSFIAKVYDEYEQRKAKFLYSFDVALFLVRKEIKPFPQRAAVEHHFIFTDLIINVYRTPTNLTELLANNPFTYFVHGKYINA